MAGNVCEDNEAGRPSEGISSGERCEFGDALAEWRSSEQVENGITSTSPPYWDTDDDDDYGAKPSELYGKFTWKIENFSQISKRELKSNAFEVGGYKWYILIYPQGCDVCNHLSLFLCVANHDKLLPGWSHFAQFTIAVVNKDPKKSKYSDTLHRFWKKEHDWGWKKFMELSKVLDGFVVSDTLVIKAQVQVIREKAHCPFRCLDCHYRRELVRVYLTNVETICRRFVEEKRGKLSKLIEDKVRWSSFCSFWLGLDQSARHHMSREKTESILRIVVKHFFVEKEVTSTLVMDSLYSGLKALEWQSQNKKGKGKLVDVEEMPAPVVCVEEDMFVLADDFLILLERAALEPLPPRDDKGPQNRTKDGCSGEEFNKDSIERDERRLTEMGRRTVQIFVLAHIFSNRIEVAYQEAVALKRQEELIREEEAAGQAEIEHKAKRGATEKEKRSKKKQAKQKRSSRKGKDRGRSDPTGQEKHCVPDVSGISDDEDDVSMTHCLDLEDRDASPVHWETDTSEINPSTEVSGSSMSCLPIQNGGSENPCIMDDSSSTCSTDSVPFVVINGRCKGNSFQNYKSQVSSTGSGKSQWTNSTCDRPSRGHDTHNQPLERVMDAASLCDATGSRREDGPELEADVRSLTDRLQLLQQHYVEKEEEAMSLQRKLSLKHQVVQVDVNRPSKQMTAEAPCCPSSTGRETFISQLKLADASKAAAESIPFREASSNGPSQSEKVVPPVTRSSQKPCILKMDGEKPMAPAKAASMPMMVERTVATQQVSAMSRPLSAPLIPAPRPNVPVVSSTVQTAPFLSRSASAAGRLGTDPSSVCHIHVPQSYRNAITGRNRAASSTSLSSHVSLSSPSLPLAYTQPHSATATLPMLSPQISSRNDQRSLRSSLSVSTATPELLNSQSEWRNQAYQEANQIPCEAYPFQRLGVCASNAGWSQMDYADEAPASLSARQSQGMASDEFPHLDIINSLFDDEQHIVRKSGTLFPNPNNGRLPPLSGQFMAMGDVGVAGTEPSINSGRFLWPMRYTDNGIQRTYSPSSMLYDGLRDDIPQAGLPSFPNGQIDVMSHWHMNGADLSLFGARNAEGDAYPFQFRDYSNFAGGANGYSVFRHGSGH